jgi:hypothetical protein
MPFRRIKVWIAGAIALLMGVPFAERASAQAYDIVEASIGLGLAIADSAGNS